MIASRVDRFDPERKVHMTEATEHTGEEDKETMTQAELEQKFDELHATLTAHLARADALGELLSKRKYARTNGTALRRTLKRIRATIEKERRDHYGYRKNLVAMAKISQEAFDLSWSPSAHHLSVLRLERQTGALCFALERCLRAIDGRSSTMIESVRRERRVAWPIEEALIMLETSLKN